MGTNEQEGRLQQLNACLFSKIEYNIVQYLSGYVSGTDYQHILRSDSTKTMKESVKLNL